jgi:hypothetical protein
MIIVKMPKILMLDDVKTPHGVIQGDRVMEPLLLVHQIHLLHHVMLTLMVMGLVIQ